MKSFLSIASAVILSVVGHAALILAEDARPKDNTEADSPGRKGECMLIAINCGNDYRALDQKIESLRKEIAKGSDVYSDDELRMLGRQLDNARKTREFFRKEEGNMWYKYPGE